MVVSFTNSPDDNERAVLPTIVYARDYNEFAKGFIIGFGWWKWGIRFAFVKIKDEVSKL